MKTLLQRTRDLMNELDLSPEEIRRVCEQVGVTPRWYGKVQNDKIKDPSVNRVEALYLILSVMKKAA